jgi:hypothetical protein
MPISAAFSTWPVRAAECRREARSRHGASDADFALAAHLGAGDRGIALVQEADCARCEQEAPDARGVAPRGKSSVVMHHRRHDAGCAVRRRRDHLPAAAFSSFTCERPGIDPFHRVRTAASASSARFSSGARRFTFRTPGSTPSAANPRPTQACITVPDARQLRIHLGRRPECLLVHAHQLGDRESGAFRLPEQFLAAAEWQREPARVPRPLSPAPPPHAALRRRPIEYISSDRSVAPAASRAVKRMPFEWPGSIWSRWKRRFIGSSNAISWRPSSRMRELARIR